MMRYETHTDSDARQPRRHLVVEHGRSSRGRPVAYLVARFRDQGDARARCEALSRKAGHTPPKRHDGFVRELWRYYRDRAAAEPGDPG